MELLPDCPDLSLVIACYNEENLLAASVAELFEALDLIKISWEMIFVDDCSRDRTRELIDGIIAANKHRSIRRIFHEKNTGRGGAVSDGFRAAKGRFVGFLDIDLEVAPCYIAPCLTKLQQGDDLATAMRIYKLQGRLLHRHLLSKGYAWLMRKALGLPFNDTETGFKFFRREKLLPLLEQVEDQGWFWDTEIMARAHLNGLKVSEVPCLFLRRYDKKSSVKILRDSLDYLYKLYAFRRKLQRIRAAALLPAAIKTGSGKLEPA